MTDKERMQNGKLYIMRGEELRSAFREAKRLTALYNATPAGDRESRREILGKLFGHAGENIYIEPTFRCDYGCNTWIGNDFYANYDCIFLDVAQIRIGDHVYLGPRVCLFTAGHPIDADVRNTNLEYGKPITIGDDVWIGGNTVVNPGVTIGDDVVIGSGSVVTKDIPPHVIAAGNPCRVIRPITEEDRIYWEMQKNDYEEDPDTKPVGGDSYTV